MGYESPSGTGSAPRYAAVILFIGFWMACGWLFHLDSNAYLVLGVPLTLVFQRLIRRQPVRALWVREAPPLRLGKTGVAIATVLGLLPLASLGGSLADLDWVGFLFNFCSVIGAVGAAYALVNFRREHLRPLAWCLLITLSLDAIQWSLFLGFGLVEMHPVEGGVPARVAVGLFSLLEYMAIVFIMEEVTLRMLDSHLHERERSLGIPSAVFLSALWGLWHLPTGEALSWQTIGILLYVHVPYGVCLSLFWRKTGTLVIPGFCHALGDAIRNGLMAAG